MTKFITQELKFLKNSQKKGIEENSFNLINYLKNPIANILLSGEKLDAFPLRRFTLTTFIYHSTGRSCNNSILFQYTSNEHMDTESKNILFTIAQKLKY